MGNRLTDSEIIQGPRANPISQLSEMNMLMEIFRLNYLVSPKDSLDFGNNAPTALLVQGFGCKKGVMSILGNLLKNNMNVVYAPDFPFMNTCSITEAATILEPTIRKVMEQEKNGDVMLIGHSNGGLIALLALHMATKLKVHNVVTMGTPHKGAPQAEKMAHLSSSCREINAEGGFLGGIDLSKQIEGSILGLIAGCDNIVPRENQTPSVLLAGRRKTKTKVLNECGHFGFLIGDQVPETAQIIQSIYH